jgi:flavin-dependent dehydrogenase
MIQGNRENKQPRSLVESEMLSAEAVATPHYDVVVLGAGVGGLAACIFLRRAGLRVVCIEVEPFPHARVGESLDWSSPGLLEAIGLPRDILVAEKIAIYKRNIKAKILGVPLICRETEDWIGKKPFEFEITTLHVDRAQFDQRLFEIAQALGVSFVWDRVTSIEREDERVVACQTAGNQRFTAPWFIDASGQARVLAKALMVPKVEYGRHKACLWTYFNTPPVNEGTTFYGDETSDYLSWIWEIPITPDVASVGYIVPADQLKELRRKGKDVHSILYDELARHPRFTALLAEQPDFQVSTCSYHSYVSKYVCGPNWLLVGESASLPDPLTANGVTAALRHAQDAAQMIKESLRQRSLSKQQQYVYNTNVCRMGHIFNYCIETAAYNRTMRRGLGSAMMIAIYTIFSYPVNALYTKIQPRSKSSMMIFGFILALVHLWMENWLVAAKLSWKIKHLRQGRPSALGTK